MTDPSSLERVFAQLPATMSVRDVAALLNTSERTVNNALRSGKLPGHKPLGEWVVFRDELRAHLEQQAKQRLQPPTSD